MEQHLDTLIISIEINAHSYWLTDHDISYNNFFVGRELKVVELEKCQIVIQDSKHSFNRHVFEKVWRANSTFVVKRRIFRF